MTWDSIQYPGAYVSVASGNLYRIPKEALLAGSSPIIHKVSAEESRYIQLSPDPSVTIHQARMLAADLNVKPNF